jgi:pimeloyl-ACP methyl ester carboxylesterase
MEKCGAGKVLPSLALIAASEPAIANGMRDAEPIFEFCVFSGETFPSLDLEYLAARGSSVGPGGATFYDADYNEVTTAAKPGRYGAIVPVTSAAGETVKHFTTLYRTPQPVDWEKSPALSLNFPPELGIDPAVVGEWAAFMEEFVRRSAMGAWDRSVVAAVLSAGLSEMQPGATLVRRRNDPDMRDLRWWCGLKKITGDLRNDYYLHLPASYEADPGKKWPLILFLHGMGERGYDLRDVEKNGLPQVLKDQPDFPFIVVGPQCLPGGWWSAPELGELLDRLLVKFRVDVDRVYLTGLSMGGFASWDLAIETPERFAAVVPVCGGGDPRDVERIKDLPIWVFHGDADDVVRLPYSEEMVDALRGVGSDVRFTVFPGVGHDSWTPAYETPELYEWLLAQRRSS